MLDDEASALEPPPRPGTSCAVACFDRRAHLSCLLFVVDASLSAVAPSRKRRKAARGQLRPRSRAEQIRAAQAGSAPPVARQVCSRPRGGGAETPSRSTPEFGRSSTDTNSLETNESITITNGAIAEGLRAWGQGGGGDPERRHRCRPPGTYTITPPMPLREMDADATMPIATGWRPTPARTRSLGGPARR